MSYLPARINLVLQIAILVIIMTAWIVKKKRHLILHGFLMFVGVILNLVSFVVVMGPSILSLEIIRTQPFHEYSLIALAHGIFGSIALTMGVVLIAAWRLRLPPRGCVKRKKVMRITIVLWTIALVLGVWFYAILYGL